MEPWNEHSEKVSKQRHDTEKAKALLKMIALREQRIPLMPLPVFTTLVAEELYEIVKELITGIMSVDGWKTTSHELLIGYLAKFYPEFNTAEVMLLDQLREMRNDIAYRGVMINPEYLDRNKQAIHEAIHKLKDTLNKRITKQR